MKQTIDRILSLPILTPDSVAAVLGISLSNVESNPRWDAFTSGPTGELLSVSLKVGRAGSWLLFLHYDPASAAQKESLNLIPYGRIVEVDVNPRIPPEGTVSFKYEYRGASLFFEFTTRTQRLRSISMERQ